jgi:hypothetical protein
MDEESFLIEYIDNELPPEEKRKLSQRLKNEPELQQRLTELERTWSFLDLLETEPPSPQLTARTMKIVAVESRQIAAVPQKTREIFNRRFCIIVPLAAAFILSFGFGMHLSSKIDPFFYRAVQRLDMYLAIADDGPAFLQTLTEKRLFLPKNETVPNTTSDSADMPILDVQLKKYHGLSKERKENIRKLHIAIETAANCNELMLTLQNYYLWRKSLQEYEKTVLRKPAPIDEKIQTITAMKERLDFLPVVSEVLHISQESELAEILADLPLAEQVEVLNNPPELIINYLQSKHKMQNE